MSRLLTAIVSALCISACSTAPRPAEVLPSEPVGEAQQATNTTQDNTETEFHSIEPPPVEQSEVPTAASNANELVCRYERRTGTHRKVRVCRTRAEMARLEEQGKDAFEEIRRSQTQGQTQIKDQ